MAVSAHSITAPEFPDRLASPPAALSVARPSSGPTEGPSARQRPPLLIRDVIAAEVERLIAILDAIDGDPDLEPEPAEPDLAGFTGTLDDREDDPAEFGMCMEYAA